MQHQKYLGIGKQAARACAAVIILGAAVAWSFHPRPGLALAQGPYPEVLIPVFTDSGAASNHFVPSNYMDGAVVPGALTLDQTWQTNPFAGVDAIKVIYNHPGGYYGGGVYWASPANNWGERSDGGIDLTGVETLTFYARGDLPNTQIEVLIGGIGYSSFNGVTNCANPTAPFPDSVCPPIKRQITLSTSWTLYTVNLALDQRDFSRTIGGFGFYASQSVVFYLDNIIYHVLLDNQLYLPHLMR